METKYLYYLYDLHTTSLSIAKTAYVMHSNSIIIQSIITHNNWNDGYLQVLAMVIEGLVMAIKFKLFITRSIILCID